MRFVPALYVVLYHWSTYVKVPLVPSLSAQPSHHWPEIIIFKKGMGIPQCRQAMVPFGPRPAAMAKMNKVQDHMLGKSYWAVSLFYFSSLVRAHTACQWDSRFISVSPTFLSSSFCPLPWFSPPTCSSLPHRLVFFPLHRSLWPFNVFQLLGVKGCQGSSGTRPCRLACSFFFSATGGPGKGSSLCCWAVDQEDKDDCRVHWAEKGVFMNLSWSLLHTRSWLSPYSSCQTPHWPLMSCCLACSQIPATANHVWASGALTLCIKQYPYSTHTPQHPVSHTLLFTGLQSDSFDQRLWLSSINDPSSSMRPFSTKKPHLPDPWLYSKPQFTPDMELTGSPLRLLTAFRLEIIHAFF